MSYITPSSTKYQIMAAVACVMSIIKTSRCTSSEAYKLFDDYILNELNTKTAAGRARYTAGQRAYIKGMVDISLHSLWQDVEFCYRTKDGKVYGTHQDTKQTHKTSDLSSLAFLNDCESAHLWKGTTKEFTNWSVM